MREKDGYRLQLESIIAAFPQREVLSVSDVARYTGFNRDTVSRNFALTKSPKSGKPYITRTQLARQLTG
ncbi:MAG: hypothetical protein RSF84_07680 [Ruthenibacterium sp.]